MKKIKVSFRLEEDLYLRLIKETPNLSKLLRTMVVTGLFKMAWVRQEELDELIIMNEMLRKTAVNFNQSVRGLKMAIVHKEPVRDELLKDLKQASLEIHLLRNSIMQLIGRYYGS